MKISIIMPTYNSISKIKIMLDSLNMQTFKDFELIVTDSDSTDGTVEFINTYKFENIIVKVISAPNCSPALARNMGIEKADGDYLAFCDSDDFMNPKMLEVMYNAININKADIAVCDFSMVYIDRTMEKFSKLNDGVFSFENNSIVDYYYKFSGAPKPNNYVWSRMYRKEFLIDNNIKFPNTRYSEDNLFNLSLLLKSPKIVHVGQSLYDYIQHDDSAMRVHIRKTNHGKLFLETFHNAKLILKNEGAEISEPILAIYAFTRVKSILFYAWQAKLTDNEIADAVDAFVSDDFIKNYLSMCIDKNYISDYCKLHDFSPEWTESVRNMILACLGEGKFPDMSGIFA